MKAWNLLDRTAGPDGKTTITLHEHDGSYFIGVDGKTLMSTRQHTSEEVLATLGCAHVKGVRGARVLIGGLGFGFTLRAALAVLAADAKIVVAELLGPVIDWNRNPAYPLAADAMADPRVTVVQKEVGQAIRESRREFDSILLDVDNGPAAVSAEANRRLYEYNGLQELRAALRPGGCAAFWAAADDPPFAKLMERAGFEVEMKRARAHGKAGSKHSIFLGRLK